MCLTLNNTPIQVNNFLNYLKTIEGNSINTINTYKSDLNCLFKFLKKYKNNSKETVEKINIIDIDNSFIKNISFTDLCSYMSFLDNRGNSANDRSRQTSAIKSFFNYLEKKIKLITENPSEELKKPKIPNRQPIYLTIEESKKLLNYVKIYSQNGKRDYCMVNLFLVCGLRVSELCNINIEDIKDNKLQITGKGNKQRILNLDNNTINSIKEWLTIRNKKQNKIIDRDKNALFISKKNQRLTPDGVEKLIKKWSKELGLTDKLTPHKLRHTCATSKYKMGVSTLEIQKILGHENISTTQIYTHIDEEDFKQACEVNPFI